MTWFDYGVISILGFSLLVGVLRGLLRELVMLVGWICAFVLATVFSKQITPLMPESLGPMLGPLLAYVAIFVAVLITAGFIALLLTLLAKSAGMGALNRMMGAGFGVLRGLLVVLALVLVAGFTPLPKEPFWRNAVSSGAFETVIVAARPLLPEELRQRIVFR
ncbi:MAG: CvpA family protein [Betaproteobacteria bacterium]|nr:CvpA family protein [Betaproteobacteria bacterium]